MINFIMTIVLKIMAVLAPPQKPLVFSGESSSAKLVKLMVLSGIRNPLLVTDRFLLEAGLIAPLLDQLEACGCKPVVFDEVTPNPTMAVVEQGLETCLLSQCDAVLVVGGGSAIDTAKVIAAAATADKGLEKLAGILKVKRSPLPLYAVPTTSGTGSEVTTAAVISDTETHRKAFFVDPKLIPLAAALDPSLLKSLPPAMTAAVGMDALTHAIEAYTSRSRSVESDREAELAIRLITDYLPAAFDNGEDLQAREMLAIASFSAGYAFTKSSLGMVHAISHQISAHYNTPHGLANAVILPRVLRLNRDVCAHRYAALERILSPSHAGSTDSELSDRFIARIDKFSERLLIPGQLEDLQRDDFDSIARHAISEARSSYALPRTFKAHEIIQVLNSVYSGNLSTV